MRRHYLTLRLQFRQLEPVDRFALATIPAALIVAAVVVVPWPWLAGFAAVVGLAILAARRPAVRPVASPAPLPGWIAAEVPAESPAAVPVPNGFYSLDNPAADLEAANDRIRQLERHLEYQQRERAAFLTELEAVRTAERDAAADRIRVIERESAEKVLGAEQSLSRAAEACERLERKAEEYRHGIDAISELYDSMKFAAKLWESNCERQADLAWDAEVEAYKADKLYRQQLERNEKLRARLAEWDSRRAAARIRRMRTLSNRLTLAEKRASIRRWIRKYGGIDANSHAFRAASGFKDRADAIANGFPRELLPRRGGQAFDILAQEFHSNGHFQCPNDRHETDYLLDLIYADAPDVAYDSGERHELAGELAALQSEHDAEDISFNVSEFAA